MTAATLAVRLFCPIEPIVRRLTHRERFLVVDRRVAELVTRFGASG